MTDHNRDALIKKAAEAMVEYDNPGVYERGDVIADWDDYVGAARVALAVFEQAHTPALNRQKPDSERAELIADLEREAARWSEPQAGIGMRSLLSRAVMHLREPGFEQAHTTTGEPDMGPAANCAYCVGSGGYEDHDGEWVECSCQRRTVQGEPTDAVVQAFMKTFWEYAPPPGAESRVRAALRAAAAVREGGQGR